MAAGREQIHEMVCSAVRQIGLETGDALLQEPSDETRLMGEKSGMDSIALVSLIAELEARVSEETGKDVVLADESAMSSLRSPFRRVGVLVDFICTKLNAQT